MRYKRKKIKFEILEEKKNCNIRLFQPMLVFCHDITEMLRTKVTDDGCVCGWTNVLQFS